MKLPQQLNINAMQNQWATAIEPVLNNPVIQGLILPNIALTTGSNSVNHRLARKLVGWYIVRQRGPASIYDTQDANQMPQLTLSLTSSADVVVDIAVF